MKRNLSMPHGFQWHHQYINLSLGVFLPLSPQEVLCLPPLKFFPSTVFICLPPLYDSQSPFLCFSFPPLGFFIMTQQSLNMVNTNPSYHNLILGFFVMRCGVNTETSWGWNVKSSVHQVLQLAEFGNIIVLHLSFHFSKVQSKSLLFITVITIKPELFPETTLSQDRQQ